MGNLSHFCCTLASLLITFFLSSFLLSSANELAPLIAKRDTVGVWRSASTEVAEGLTRAIEKQSGRPVKLQSVDLHSLKILQGTGLELALEVEGTQYKFFETPEVAVSNPASSLNWNSLVDALPTSAGGYLTKSGNALTLENEWNLPILYGPRLPEFTLSGPLDLYIRPASATIQLWLPHLAEFQGKIARVIVKNGAVINIRGASGLSLKNRVDLPSISLGEFADIVQSDEMFEGAEGLTHLANGLRQKATQLSSSSSKATSLSPSSSKSKRPAGELVGFSLDVPGSLTILTAPDDQGRLQKLRVRALGEGIVELSPRDAPSSSSSEHDSSTATSTSSSSSSLKLSTEESKALALANESPYVWPLKSVHTESLAAYERLLRELLASSLFKGVAGEGGVPPQSDVQLKLLETAAKAVTLLQLELEVDPIEERGEERGGGDNDDEPPSVMELIQRKMLQAVGVDWRQLGLGGGGKDDNNSNKKIKRPLVRERWQAVVKLEGNLQTGLQFKPVKLERVDSGGETVTIGTVALEQYIGGNVTTLLATQMLNGGGGGDDDDGANHDEL
jgi:hypothetical protein